MKVLKNSFEHGPWQSGLWMFLSMWMRKMQKLPIQMNLVSKSKQTCIKKHCCWCSFCFCRVQLETAMKHYVLFVRSSWASTADGQFSQVSFQDNLNVFQDNSKLRRIFFARRNCLPALANCCMISAWSAIPIPAVVVRTHALPDWRLKPAPHDRSDKISYSWPPTSHVGLPIQGSTRNGPFHRLTNVFPKLTIRTIQLVGESMIWRHH